MEEFDFVEFVRSFLNSIETMSCFLRQSRCVRHGRHLAHGSVFKPICIDIFLRPIANSSRQADLINNTLTDENTPNLSIRVIYVWRYLGGQSVYIYI